MDIRDLAELYPGFPAFVHHIMHHYQSGKSPEEVAKLVTPMVNEDAVNEAIGFLEKKYATYEPESGGGYKVAAPDDGTDTAPLLKPVLEDDPSDIDGVMKT